MYVSVSWTTSQQSEDLSCPANEIIRRSRKQSIDRNDFYTVKIGVGVRLLVKWFRSVSLPFLSPPPRLFRLLCFAELFLSCWFNGLVSLSCSSLRRRTLKSFQLKRNTFTTCYRSSCSLSVTWIVSFGETFRRKYRFNSAGSYVNDVAPTKLVEEPRDSFPKRLIENYIREIYRLSPRWPRRKTGGYRRFEANQ